ncbi:MAG: ABC transporter substrate-binding protein [Thiomicrospira sp.]|jgi:PAS domain S-box-containing protein|nr:ABC transporter substrate-binding protein [Thiomicrospira sp.]
MMFNVNNRFYCNLSLSHLTLMVWVGFFFSLFPAGSQALSAGQKEPVTLQLKWTHQFQFAGYYMAKAKGYYDEVGLNVTINPAVAEKNPVMQVLQNEADFGVGHSELIINYAQGEPVVVLGVVLQRSPMGVVTINPTIHSPADFQGKKMMLDNNMAEIFAYMRQYSVEPKDVILHRHRLATPIELLRGGVDVLSIYKTTAQAGLDELRQAGHVVKTFFPHEEGVDFYGDNLFTTQRMITERPSVVRAFREASFKGWYYAINHPEETVRVILKNYITNKTYEELLKEAEAIKEFMNAGRIYPGNMTEDHWRSIAQSYQDIGYIQTVPDLSRFLYQPNNRANTPSHFFTVLIVSGLIVVILVLLWLVFRARKAKNRCEQIMDKAPMARVVFDHKLTIVDWGSESTAFFGWTAEEAVGQPLSMLVADEDVEGVAQMLNKALISHTQRAFNLTNVNKTKTGEAVTCAWTNRAFNEQGRTFLISWAYIVEEDETEQVVKNQTSSAPDKRADVSFSDEEENRQQLVAMMNMALYIWETPRRTRIDLAEQSGIWRVTLDGGTPKARTLNKYLSVDTLPGNPRWRNVLQTVSFVLEHNPEHASSTMLNELKEDYLKKVGVYM